MFIVLIQSTDGDLLDVMSVGAAVKQLADHDISQDSCASCLFPEEGVDIDTEFDD